MNKHMEKADRAFIPTPFYVVMDNGDLTVLYANIQFYKLLGRTKEEINGKYGGCLSALINPDDMRAIKDDLKNIECASGNLRFRKKDGSSIWTDTSVIPNENGQLCCISVDVTSYKNKLSAVKELEYKCRFAMEKTRSVMFEYYPMYKEAKYHGHIKEYGEGMRTVKNFPDSLIEEEAVHPDSAKDFADAVNNMALGSASSSCEARMKNPHGEYRWYQLTMERASYGGSTHIMGILEDITNRKEAALAYLRETQCYQAMLSDTEAWGDIDITENKINRVGGLWNVYNELIKKMTYDDVMRGFIKKVVHPSDREHYTAVMERNNFMSSYESGITRLGCEFRRIVSQNKMVWMRLTVHIFTDPTNGHFSAALYLADIDDEKKKELLLQRESKRDPLTDLYNKRMTETSIKEYLLNSSKKARFAFIILDIDDFKDVNDSYGHSMGDKVLIQLTSILKKYFRKDDIVGRFGGDEFIIFMKNVSSKEVVEEKLKNVCAALLDSGKIPISCSIGAVMGPKFGTEYEKLFQCADIALYSAKKSGKSTFIFYDSTKIPDNAKTEKSGESGGTERSDRRRNTVLTQEDEPREILPVSSFDSMLGEEGDMAYLVDTDTFELIKGNKAFYSRIGMSEAECIGAKCYEVLYERNSPCPFCSKLNWSENKFYIWKNYNAVLEQEFLIKNKLIQWEDKTVMLAVSVDISNNKNINDFMDENANAESILLNCVYKITEADSLETAINTALEATAHFYGAERVQLWEKSIPNEEIVLSCEYTQDPDAPLPISYERTVAGFLAEMGGGGNLWTDTPEEMLLHSFDMYKLMKSMNINNYRVCPMADKEEVYAHIVIENTHTHYRHTSFIESLCLFIVKEIQKYRREGTIEYMRRHDALTGLPNRISYEEYTGSFNSERNSSIGILAANINELGKINNSLGYDAGNAAIKDLAAILRKIFSECKIFRPSGDEFIVAAENISRDDFEEKAIILKNVIDRSDKVSAAVGYVWDDVEKNLGLLIWHAYELMKMNKRLYYDSGNKVTDQARYEILSELLSSIENGDFLVYLQPKQDILENRTVGAEALIRYRENDGKISAPAKFLGRLEEKGIIRYVDLFVFEEVCKLLERWKRLGQRDLKVSVNFSRITLFESEVLTNIEAIIKKYDVDRENIEIEITESVSEMGKDILCRIARDIKNAKFSVSLDDFGTKYTNLSTLADISFDMLKLDKSLINTLTGSRTNRIIVKNIIAMCGELGADAIAEGVETKEQEDILIGLGCRFVQGYLYGKPMPINEFEKKVL